MDTNEPITAQEVVEERLNDLPVKVQIAHHSGPIPPPEILKQYNEIDPNFANRIMSMAEAESQHRHSFEQKALQGAIDVDKRGQHYGLAISLIAITVGTWLTVSGYPKVGGTFLTATVIALATLFVTGRAKPEKNDYEQNINE